MTTIRIARPDDLDAIAALTAAKRRQLAAWSPMWWKAADGADELHRLWLGHLIGADGPIVRVVEDDDTVLGCAVSMPQRHQWFIDDIVVPDDRWADAGVALLTSVPERPGLTCLSVEDHPRAEAARAAGLTRVSTYWVRRTEPGPVDVKPLPEGVVIPAPAPHTFGGPFDPSAPDAIAFAADGGLVVGTPPTAPPPIYGGDGTVSVVDRVAGPDRAALLERALRVAGNRGDRLLAVVAAATDGELERRLIDASFEPIVAVHRWPE